MKLGILGGTFNPIHNSHLAMATLARDTLNLDRVLLMVASDPPHKAVDNGVAAGDRLRMTTLAAETLDRVEACDLELCRSGKSYTADTLTELHAMYEGATLYLILGSDMLLDLPRWYRPEQVLALATIACVPRRGEEAGDAAAAEQLRGAYGARVSFLPASVPALSSTEIRDRLAAGLPVEGCMPESVERYCYESGLYFPPDVRALQAKVKAALPERRYRHTMGVVRTAAALAERWGVDPKKARLAALLHDCAKYLDPEALTALSGDDTGILPVQHAFAGAAVAARDYGVTDPDVLQAIRLHATGDADMTPLDELVYLADLIEPNRRFPGVDGCRRAVEMGLDAGMRYALARSQTYVAEQGGAFHPASLRALRHFEEKAEK